MPFEIITDDEAASELGVAVDARLTRIVEAVHADFYEGTGRTFEKKDRTVYLRGYGPHVDFIFLPEAMIHSVAEVRIDATGVLGADTVLSDLATSIAFETEELKFKLHYLNGYFPEGDRVARVTFNAGYNTWQASGGTAPMPPQSMRGYLLEEVEERYRLGIVRRHSSMSLSGTESFTRSPETLTPLAEAICRYRRPV